MKGMDKIKRETFEWKGMWRLVLQYGVLDLGREVP